MNGSEPRSGAFQVQVAQQVGRRFTIQLTIDGNTSAHSVRCLPPDFPTWSAQRRGTPQAAFYSTALVEQFAEPTYTAVFDTNGVPIWWLPPRRTILLTPLPNGNFAITDVTGGGMQEYDLAGQLVRTVKNVGGPTDFHDVLLLPNGNYVLATVQQQTCDLSSWGLTPPNVCLNHVFQELTPAGELVWSWDTAAHIPVNETTLQWIAQQRDSVTNGVYDPYHYNSVEPTGDGYILSFRHLDAVYRIDRNTGSVVWKLSGNKRPESLTLVSDPLNGVSGQHDARLDPVDPASGKVSIHDNGTLGRGPTRPPRTVVYQIDLQQRTATLVEQNGDRDVTTSPCCGSFRRLPGGNRVVGWGGYNSIAEYQPDGTRVFRLRVGLVYRGIPILASQHSAAQFRAGMDAQYAAP